MVYLNVAGLSPLKQDLQQEVTTTLEQFSRLLYSDEGIRYYRPPPLTPTVYSARRDNIHDPDLPPISSRISSFTELDPLAVSRSLR